ncbi:MAG: aminoglycoside phosphotransferase family protein [Patescibacteria group bacterium]|jgi:aminoglycoside 2''-phosphotransferase
MKSVEFAPYLKIIKQKYPDIRQSQIVVRDYGWDFLVFIVNDLMVFRFPRDKRADKGLESQVKFANRFYHDVNLSIPRPQIENENGCRFMAYPFIQGEPLKPVWLRRCSVSKQSSMARQLGRFLTTLHAFSVNRASSLGIQKRQAGFNSYDSVAYFRVHLHPHITEKEWRWVVGRLDEIQVLIRKSAFRPVVAHNDIAPTHILFDPLKGRLTGIIDFGDLGIGDPAFDFFRLDVYPRAFLDQILSTYGGHIDGLFFEREQGYRDISLIHRLVHYMEKKDHKLVKTIADSFRRRIKT